MDTTIVRIFIAIPLPSRIRKELAKVKKEFASSPAKWVEEKNLHITLVFIGEVESRSPTGHHKLVYDTKGGQSHLAKIIAAIRESTSESPPIQLKIDGLMLFPNEKKARLLTAKLDGDPTSPRLRGAGTEELTALVEKIKDGLRARGVGFDEKQFHPRVPRSGIHEAKGFHITLARFKHLRSSERQALKDKVRTFKLPKIEFTADRVELVESKLTPTGPVYEMLATATLAGT